MDSQMKDIGAVWLKTSKAGKTYMSGTVNGQRIVMFRNERKQDGERTPDWRIYPDTPKVPDGPDAIHTALTTAVTRAAQTTSDDIPF